MSSTWGNRIKISIFGESHGAGIGVTLDGLPAGEQIDLEEISLQMARRAPGRDKTSTPRKEADCAEILSGLLNSHTTGAPLCALIRNTNTRSGDYADLAVLPRPGHADYTGYVRYHGCNDVRGGGHFSGRLTAPLTFAGAVCRQILQRRGVTIGAHIYAIHSVTDTPFESTCIPDDVLQRLSRSSFALINPDVEAAMRQEIENARLALDSVGGIVECAAAGLPAGIGSPLFGGVENVLSSILFGIPAVKGVEFGAGFGAASLRGSQNNDAFRFDEDGRVITVTNNAGGILGGISSGMPVIVRTAIKPTPSIAQQQDTINLAEKTNAVLSVQGRHDPCIVPRAVPVVESAVAVGLLDLLMQAQPC